MCNGYCEPSIQKNHLGRPRREPEHKKQDLPKVQILSKIKLDKWKCVMVAVNLALKEIIMEDHRDFHIFSKIKLDGFLTNRHVPNDIVKERKRIAIISHSSNSKESIL